MLKRVHGVSVATVAFILVGPLAAEPAGSGPGKASPAQALQAASKNFVKTKGYKVELDVNGGYADDESHAVKTRVVQETYSGEVYGGMMHLPSVKVYRTVKRGAVYVDGTWKDILSDRNTVKVARLFRFPEEVLANALRHVRRSGRWVDPAGEGKGSGEKEEGAGDGAAEAEGGAEEPADQDSPSKTAVGGTGSAGASSGPGQAPRVVRVEAPPQEALQHILDVQNSNCFGVG